MKQVIKEKLKKMPLMLHVAQKINRFLFPVELGLSEKLQQDIFKKLKHKNNVFFVQVGSNDGVQGDPLHDLIVNNNEWRGVFIEPVGFLFERLKKNYGNFNRYIYENSAIAAEAKELDFYYVSEKAKVELGDQLPFWYDQLGSFDRSHIVKHLDGALEPYIYSQKINAVPLSDVLTKHQVEVVDLVHIDTEGYDYKVLSTIDFARYKPSVILYEHKHLSESEHKLARSLLMEKGYKCSEYGSDTLATIEK